MHCREAETQIFAERDGALDEVRRAALAQHLGECATCRQLRENFAVTITTWRSSVENMQVPDAELEWQQLRREIRGGAGSKAAAKRPRLLLFAVPLAAAAAFAIALVV